MDRLPRFHARLLFVCLTILCFLFALSHVPSLAGTSEGLDWLESQAQPDGAVAIVEDKATAYQSTAETLRAFHVLGITGPVESGARQYLADDSLGNVEHLARRLIDAADSGDSLTTLINGILLLQNSNGGWGEFGGYASTAVDTAFAVEALGHAGFIGDEIGAALYYLSGIRNTDGGWSHGTNESSVYATAQVLAALSEYQGFYSLANEIDAAQNFILAQQAGGGLWSEDFESALALIGLINTSSDLSGLSDSLSSLRALQQADGSWSSEVYATALALRALTLSEASPTNPGLASISGVITDGQTGLALSGVTVDLGGSATRQLVSGSDGGFIFTDLVAGSYTLVFSLANYNSITATTTVGSQQNVDFGTIQMLQGANATTGTIRGTVTDAASGTGLSGVTIMVSTVAGSVQSDANGDFQVSNVPTGSLSIQAELAGYSTAAGTANMTAGGLLVFSPALTPVTSPTTAVQGAVTDADTGQPLSGATVSITGSTTATTQTDGQGAYLLENLTPGTITIEVTQTGYDSAMAITSIAQNQIIEFSPALYPDNTTPPDANSAGVRGVVLDSTTGQPLAGVAVTATFGTDIRNLVTDASGVFEVTGFTDTSGELAFSYSGYTGVVIAVELVPLEILDIGQVRLRPEGVTQLLPDLEVQSVDLQPAVNDSQSLRYSGDVAVEVANTGTAAAGTGISVLAFYDINGSGSYEVGGATYNDPGDTVLGTATLTSGLAAGEVQSVSIVLDGHVPYRDAPVSVWVDSAENIAEANETNNVGSSSSQCVISPPPAGSFNPVVKYHALMGTNIISTPIVINLTDDNQDGLINSSDTPDIVFPYLPGSQFAGGNIKAISGDDGRELFTTTTSNEVATLSELAVGDIDADGFPEIVAAHSSGQNLIAFEHDGSVKWVSDTHVLPGRSDAGGTISIANLDGMGRPEIIIGASVYDADGNFLGDGRDLGGTHGFSRYTAISAVADIDLDGLPEIIAGPSVYRFSNGALTLDWTRPELGDGFIGIGNFDADEFAELVIVGDGRIRLLNHDGTGVSAWGDEVLGIALPVGGTGGAPTIADFDGDGLPEIGVAGSSAYSVIDTDGSVLWQSPTVDISSSVTGSTSFDFEGDGVAEIVYRDEHNFRIYRGTDGQVLYEQPMRSGTATEMPVIADVDNDGHAEIVVCADRLYGGALVDTGIYVFADAGNSWMPTRNIWNQHAYHINNINDDGTVPQFEEPSWLTHNTYRLNTFLDRDALDSVDLTAGHIQVIESGIDQSLRISAIIGNAGQVGTPASVDVAFYEGDPDAGGVQVGTVVLQPLAADSYQFAILENVTLQGGQPIHVVVDPQDSLTECREDNNRAAIGAPDLKPDLAVADIDRSAMTSDLITNGISGSIDAVIHNLGNLASGGAGELRAFFDANQSGAYEAESDVLLGSLNVADLAVAVNDTAVFSIPVTGTLPFRDAAIHVWVDSQEQITEFDETNNVGATTSQCVSGTDGPHEPIYVADWEVGRPVTNAEGGHGSPYWSFSGGGYVAYQGGNVQSTTLTGEPLSNGVIEGIWYNSGYDNDGIGIVFGFQDVKHHYNFWADRDYAGCCGGNHRLVRYGDNNEQLYIAPGGWYNRTWMRYRLEFKPGKFTITFSVDSTGQIIDSFTIRDDTYTDGLFGFWGGSQGGVTYRAWNVPQITGASTDATLSQLTLVTNSDGEPDILRARVGNGGAVAFDQPLVVSFHQGDPAAGGVLLGEVTVDALAPGQYQDVELSGFINPLAGGEDIHATVDLAEAQSDCDRGNNTMVLPVAQAGQFGQITASTDATVYPPSTAALLQANVMNTGVLPGHYTGVLQVEDAAGAVVATLPAHDLGELAATASTTFSDTWNTASYLAGPYVLRGLLYGADGTLLHESVSLFSIEHPAGSGSAVTLRTTTDKPVYHSTATVQIQDVIQNLTQSTLYEDALLRLTVMDPDGQTIHSQDVQLGQLLPETVRDLTHPLVLQEALLGTYAVMGAVIDNQNGALLAADMTQFEVVTDPGLVINGTVTAGFATREAGEAQTCTDVLSNDGAATYTDLPVRQVFARLDEPLELAMVETLQTLAAGSGVMLERTLETTGLDAGDYACILQANLDGAWTTLDAAIFTVTVPPINIEAALATGDRGRVLVLVDTATNGGGAESCTGMASVDLGLSFNPALADDASATVQLFDATGTLIDSELVDLATVNGPVNAGTGTAGVDLRVGSFSTSGALLSLDATATTDGLLGTAYRVVTTLTEGSAVRTLDSTLIPTSCQEPVFISDIFGGYQIRGLSLVDAANDPHGNADIPAPWYQQDFLEQLLDDAGWTYTVVTDGDAFAGELRSGGYTTYLLLSEQVQLAVGVEEELREAVYRGEGLVVAGGHDQRNSRFEDALGVKVIGKHSNATGVSLPASALHAGFSTDFIFGEHTLRLELAGATAAGSFNFTAGGTVPAETAAVLTRDYGAGKSVMAGFDLLAEATGAGAGSPFAQLLLNALAYVQPAGVTPYPGAVIPLELTLTNLGIATPGEAVLTLPAGVTVVDGGAATPLPDGTLDWVFDLTEGEVATLVLWVRLPGSAATLDITATVLTGTAPDLVEHTTAELAVVMQPLATLSAALGQLAPIATDNSRDNGYRQAGDSLDKAQVWLDGANDSKALQELLKATTYLLGIGEPEADAIRLQIDQVIRGVEQRL